MAYSLLYVSKTLLEFPAGAAEVAKIIEGSLIRNASLGITGALMSTSNHFAQVLEGGRAAVEELMASINRDPRHMKVKIIRVTEEKRRFPDWALAYSGTAGLVDRHIAPLFSSLPVGDTAHLALRLLAIMEEFARLPSG